MASVVVSGSFDNLRSPGVRFLHEASRLGRVHVRLWSDAAIERETGEPPRFPEAERQYLVQAIRYVASVELVQQACDLRPAATGDWTYVDTIARADTRERCRAAGMAYHVIPSGDLVGFPEHAVQETPGGRKKVIVTGCYDWLHSGHVRFFEEAAGYGCLYVVVGNDANVRRLKGDGHPQFRQEERRYLVGAIRHVHRAMVSTGVGWLDAAPEIAEIRPDIYIVNEDGDKPEKRDFCERRGIEYIVLRRVPREGLPRRQSTDLRGF